MRTLLILPLLLLAPAPALAQAPSACAGEDLPPPYAALVAAERALVEGRTDEALAAIAEADGVAPGPPARRRALLHGRALLAAGEPGPARAALLPLLDGGPGEPGYRPTPCGADPGEVRALLARTEADAAAATAHRLTLWTHNPTSPASADAEEALAAEGALPTPDDVAGRARIRARAETLTALNAHAEALALLDRLPLEPTDASRRERARAAARGRQYARAAELFASLEDPGPEDRFDRALSISRTGDYAAAAAVYGTLLEVRPDSPEAQEASFKLGYLAWDGGDHEAALAAFDTHRARYPGGKRDNEALWFRGWSLFRLGRLDEAEAALRELGGRSSSLAPGARYWTARILGLRGDPAGEEAGLRALVEQDTETIYGWWASSRLGLRFEAKEPLPVPPAAALTAALSEQQAAALDRALSLSRRGPSDWARAELDPLASAVQNDRARALAVAHVLDEAGAWNEARALARRWCGEGSTDREALQLCWPRPLAESVATAAAAAGLHPLLPFAIMHAESGFDPRVVSHAGARGLMQLMPALVDVPPDALFDPAVNTRLGVDELGSLRRSLSDTGVEPLEPLVIAGYNGGEEAVRRWLKGQPAPLDVDRWAEEISYSETRRYVRRVLGALMTYRRLYGDP